MKTKENSPANGANLRKYSPAETQRLREISVGQASRLPSTQGRDGSPQPSQVSGADAPSWPFKLQVSGLNSPAPPLRASAPPREISPLRSQVSAFRFQASAFTLLEVLVATAVLALMMAFLFNLLGSSAKIWEIGNKKIEAAQAARVGLNIIAKDLKNAFAGNMTSYTTNGTAIQNYANFIAWPSPQNTINLQNAITLNGTHQIRAIVSTGDSSDPFNEVGLLCAYITQDHGQGMKANRCYLVRKVLGSDIGSIYLKSTVPSATPTPLWDINKGTWTNFTPIVDNCIGLTFEYAYNSGGSVIWTNDPNNDPTPSSYSTLPLGVLVTVTVLDSKTAEKVAQLASGDPMASSDTNVQRLISQGSVTMSRFIPFNAQ